MQNTNYRSTAYFANQRAQFNLITLLCPFSIQYSENQLCYLKLNNPALALSVN